MEDSWKTMSCTHVQGPFKCYMIFPAHEANILPVIEKLIRQSLVPLLETGCVFPKQNYTQESCTPAKYCVSECISIPSKGKDKVGHQTTFLPLLELHSHPTGTRLQDMGTPTAVPFSSLPKEPHWL